LVRELYEVPAGGNRRAAEPVHVAREVDAGGDDGKRDEQDERVQAAPAKEVERPARTGISAFVRARGDGDRRDQQADERVRARPLRREREPEEHAGDENVERGPASRSMSREDRKSVVEGTRAGDAE